jgi:flagellar motor switch protein FliN/FliY
MKTDDLYTTTADQEGSGPDAAMDVPSGTTAVSKDESDTLVQDLTDAVTDTANLDLLLDVNLQVSVELGRASLKFREVLNLAPGAVVELDRQTSEPVDILVNGSLLATGEVVVVDDHFAVRITKLLNRVERLKKVL